MSLSNQSERKRILINTELDRNSISRDNVSIYLNDPIPHLRNKIKVALRKVVLPNTAYSYHPEDSRLYYITDVGGANNLKHITIDTKRVINGVQELSNHLSQLFTNNGDSIDVTFDNETKKLTFTNNTPNTIRLVSSEDWESSIGGTDLVKRCNNKIGLVQDLRTSTLPNGGFTVTKYIPKIQNTMAYHLVSFNLVDNATSITPDKDVKLHTLATVMNDRNWGDNIIEEKSEEEVWPIELNRDLDQIDLRVLDDKYREVSLNGAEMYIELEAEYE
jgi:phosphotransferase system IIB component